MLRHRVRSGLLLGGALLAGVFFLPPLGVLIVLMTICALALLEFYALLDASQIPHFKVVGIVCGVLMVLATWLSHHGVVAAHGEMETFLLFGALAATLLRQISYKGGERAWETIAGTLLGLFYIAFLYNFFTKLLCAWGDERGRFLMLFLVIVVKCTDIGAYFTGCAIGRHKLIPRISPAKTWEGCIGGVLAGMGAGWLVFHLMRGHAGWVDFSTAQVLGIGFALAVAGILGDLIESLFKRAAGVKDSSTLIQGMGGLLDVLDSLLFAAPVLYIAAHYALGAAR